jgi:hypothetical protein
VAAEKVVAHSCERNLIFLPPSAFPHSQHIRDEAGVFASPASPLFSPDFPNKIMVDAAGPLKRRPLGALGFICSQPTERVRFDASAVGSKHGDDREKPRPWEMPVVRQGGA